MIPDFTVILGKLINGSVTLKALSEEFRLIEASPRAEKKKQIYNDLQMELRTTYTKRYRKKR